MTSAPDAASSSSGADAVGGAGRHRAVGLDLGHLPALAPQPGGDHVACLRRPAGRARAPAPRPRRRGASAWRPPARRPSRRRGPGRRRDGRRRGPGPWPRPPRPTGRAPRARPSRRSADEALDGVGRREDDPVVGVGARRLGAQRRAAVGGVGDGDHGELDDRGAGVGQGRDERAGLGAGPGHHDRARRPGAAAGAAQVEGGHGPDDDRARGPELDVGQAGQGRAHAGLGRRGAPVHHQHRRVGAASGLDEPAGDLGAVPPCPSGPRACRPPGPALPSPPRRARRDRPRARSPPSPTTTVPGG